MHNIHVSTHATIRMYLLITFLWCRLTKNTYNSNSERNNQWCGAICSQIEPCCSIINNLQSKIHAYFCSAFN